MSLVLTLRSRRTGSLVPGSIRTRVLPWIGIGIHANARTVVLKQLKLYRMFFCLGWGGASRMPEESRASRTGAGVFALLASVPSTPVINPLRECVFEVNSK